jgi:SRSO17 transposase
MALQAKVPPRSLQEFVSLHGWKAGFMRDRVQKIVIRDHGDEDAIVPVDETGCPKKGNKTVGVKRQYCGATGKIDNCVVSVHLGYVTKDFHTLLDSDLYLPEDWCADAKRRQEAGIPDSVVFREKWRIALDELEHAKQNGVPFRWVTADENYGRVGAFRKGVSELGYFYVVEIPCSITGWTRRPLPGPAGKPARRVEKLWRRGGPSWQTFHIKDTEKGPVVWEARTTRLFVVEEDFSITEHWLLVARNVLDGEIKYFLSNAPPDTPVEKLLHVAFSRSFIEREFEDSKGEIGFDHFEVRGYPAVMHHFALSLVSLLFLAKEANRLSGEKKLPEIHVEPAPGPQSGRGATR